MHFSKFLLLTGLCLGACAKAKEPAGIGQKCKIADDCIAGLVCAANSCTPPQSAVLQKVIVQAPHDVHYEQASMVCTIGVPIAENRVFYRGDDARDFVANPALPSGLVLDPVNGKISGIPTARATKQTYTVAATNEAGSGWATIDLTVLDVPLKPTLQAKAYYKEVTLTWGAMERASSYTIYWNTTGNVTANDQKIENLKGPSFMHAVPEPKTYYYRIAGVGVDGIGELSEEISVNTYAVIQVSVGKFHTCVLLSGGKVRCWGRGDEGELGYGDGKSLLSPINKDVPLDGEAVQISSGHYHTCATLKNGNLYCWGWNPDGQLGYGHTDNVLGPTSAVPVGGEVAQVVAGLVHTCALLKDGRVRCWGYGGDGELGYGDGKSVGNGKNDVTPIPLQIHSEPELAGC